MLGTFCNQLFYNLRLVIFRYILRYEYRNLYEIDNDYDNI